MILTPKQKRIQVIERKHTTSNVIKGFGVGGGDLVEKGVQEANGSLPSIENLFIDLRDEPSE